MLSVDIVSLLKITKSYNLILCLCIYHICVLYTSYRFLIKIKKHYFSRLLLSKYPHNVVCAFYIIHGRCLPKYSVSLYSILDWSRYLTARTYIFKNRFRLFYRIL